jgi:hypothetical protein
MELHGKQQQQLVSSGACRAGIGAVGLERLVQEYQTLRLDSTNQGSAGLSWGGSLRLDRTGCGGGPGCVLQGGCSSAPRRRAEGILQELEPSA